MNKEQIDLLIDTAGNEVIEFIEFDVILDSNNKNEIVSFFQKTKINETLN